MIQHPIRRQLPARDRAEMTVRTVKTAGEGKGDGDGLRGSTPNASTQPASGDITARKRPGCLAIERRRHLMISPSVIDFSATSTAILGRRPSGIFRMKRV